jgi:drug/metabolite transporter (DMT)-like permease
MSPIFMPSILAHRRDGRYRLGGRFPAMPAGDEASPHRPAERARRDMDVAGAALALLISLFWGISPVTVKIAFADVAPIRLAVWRFLLGGVVILLWAWVTRRLAGLRVERSEWRPLIVVGLILAVQTSLINFGTERTSAAHAAVILNSYAVHVVVLAHFLVSGDRFNLRRFGGVVVAYVGVLALFVRRPDAGGVTLAGDTLVIASSMLLAVRTVYLARVVQRIDRVKLLLAQIAIAGTCLLAYSAGFEGATTRWTPRLVAILLFQGVVVAAFNFVIDLSLLRRYRPSALAACYLTQPIFGVVAAGLMAGDRLTVELIVASVAVTVGIWLARR